MKTRREQLAEIVKEQMQCNANVNVGVGIDNVDDDENVEVLRNVQELKENLQPLNKNPQDLEVVIAELIKDSKQNKNNKNWDEVIAAANNFRNMQHHKIRAQVAYEIFCMRLNFALLKDRLDELEDTEDLLKYKAICFLYLSKMLEFYQNNKTMTKKGNHIMTVNNSKTLSELNRGAELLIELSAGLKPNTDPVRDTLFEEINPVRDTLFEEINTQAGIISNKLNNTAVNVCGAMLGAAACTAINVIAYTSLGAVISAATGGFTLPIVFAICAFICFYNCYQAINKNSDNQLNKVATPTMRERLFGKTKPIPNEPVDKQTQPILKKELEKTGPIYNGL